MKAIAFVLVAVISAALSEMNNASADISRAPASHWKQQDEESFQVFRMGPTEEDPSSVIDNVELLVRHSPGVAPTYSVIEWYWSAYDT